MRELAYACQNCLHELNAPAAVCPECTTTGAIAHKTQIPFFNTPHNHSKPELRYCNRCRYRTIHQLTHCPNCDTPVKNFLHGRNAFRLMTRREGSNAEIVIGCVVLIVSVGIGLLILFLSASTPMTNEKILTGLAVISLFALTGFGFIIKALITKIIGGR